MIIGRDRTNQPVTSSEEFNSELSYLKAVAQNAVMLYRHNIVLYNDNDERFMLTIISTKDDNYTDANLSDMVNSIYADEGLVSMFYNDGYGTYKAVVIDIVDNNDHTIEIIYGASSSIRIDDSHQTYEEEIERL